MYLHWNDTLATGHPRIDSDHKKLLDVVNRLADAMGRGFGKETCVAVLDELIKHTKSHFEMEEALMRSLGARYVDAAAHRRQHAKLLEDVSDFQTQFRSGTLTLSVPLKQFLEGWLFQHVKDSDKALASAANAIARPTFVPTS